MIQIVYIIPSLIKSGPISVLYNILKHLDRRRFNPIIIELRVHPLRDRHNHELFENLGIKIDRRNYSLWYTQMNFKRLAKDISKNIANQTRFSCTWLLSHTDSCGYERQAYHEYYSQ